MPIVPPPQEFTPPSKEAVRAWLYGQVSAKVAPPSREDIRRALWAGQLVPECAR